MNNFCTLDTVETKNKAFGHEPVLIAEVCQNLDLAKKRVVVDCTLGLGGHSIKMLELMPAAGKLIAFDLDNENIKQAKKRLKAFKDRITVVHGNFSTLKAEIGKLRLKGIDAVLFDLGLSSVHTDDPEKGFSFLREGPLDMRFDHKQDLTAADVVNKYTEKDLIRIFKEYGEEQKARKVAMEIVKMRKKKPFTTTTQLADMIEKLLKRQGRIHPATRVFQALRIEVNDELGNLRSALEQAIALLRPKGRIAVISYHSLEDRIVKRFFREQCRDYVNLPGEMTTTLLDPTLDIVTKKPIVPLSAEIASNPRSRSAKLRVAEKL